jgi:hypothetical protein
MKVLRWLKCIIGNHDFQLIQELTDHSRRIGCPHCQKIWGMNDQVQCVVEWDSDIEEMYRLIGVKVEPFSWDKSPEPSLDGRSA